jgi:Membrane carboxypeptidase (penicillin-binding protein)
MRPPPQRFRPGAPPAAARPGPEVPHRREVPLLTHDDTPAALTQQALTQQALNRHAPAQQAPTQHAGSVRGSVRPDAATAVVARSGGAPGGPPRGGRRTAAAPRDPRRRWLRWTLGALGTMILLPFLAFVIGWVIFKVPSADEVRTTQQAVFTFADATTPVATVRPEGGGNRIKVPLDRVPVQVRQAVLAAEDATFYSNPGFDLSGILRAIYNQVTGGVGGGSTITQQYIKVTTGQDQSSGFAGLWRKYKEIVLAVKISREYTKDEILENYLNTIYLGRGASGIQTASLAYFGKDVDQLTVSEGALLAGVIQSPSRWDPAKSRPDAERRWNFVLDQMVQNKWLSPEERAALQFPETKEPEPLGGGVPGDDRFHIYNRAKAELLAMGITEDQIETEGLTVVTTIDQKTQQKAVEAVKAVKRGQPENLRYALTAVDPRTGAIMAYYGGDNISFDYAGNALRQPGSSFKPFVFAAALQAGKGIGLGTVYDGTSPQTIKGTVFNNSESASCPNCTVLQAMTQSVNTVFIHMADQIGIQKVIDAAHAAGIPENLVNERRLGLALGDQDVHPLDMAVAYATFAADGVRHQPFLVQKVTTADGRVLYEAPESPAGEQAFPQQVARNVTESMMQVASTSGVPLSGGRPAASKSGTAQNEQYKGQNRDAWYVGYTPQLSTAVWVGSDKSDPIKNSAGRPIYGRMLPGSIWQRFMNQALAGKPIEQFSPFEPMGTPPYYGDDDDDDDEDEDDYEDGEDRRGRGDRGERGGRGDDGDDEDYGLRYFGDSTAVAVPAANGPGGYATVPAQATPTPQPRRVSPVSSAPPTPAGR